MKKIIRLTENDLTKIVRKVINEEKKYSYEEDPEEFDRGFSLKDDEEFIQMCESLSEKLKSWIESPNKVIAKNINDIYQAIEKVEDYAYDKIENLEPDHMPYFFQIKHKCIYINHISRNITKIRPDIKIPGTLYEKCEELKELFKMLIRFLDNYTS